MHEYCDFWDLKSGIYGGSYKQPCLHCDGVVEVKQYMNCACYDCGNIADEVFEYCCNNCSEYGTRCRFTVDDPENPDISYSWVGLGLMVDEIEDIEDHKLKAVLAMKNKLGDMNH